MRRVLGVLVVAVVAVLAGGGPAVAGGPTSVLVSMPGTGRVGALYTGSADYEALGSAVGVFGTLPTSEPSPSGSGQQVTLTWLIHDVQPWRVDRVYLGGGGGDVWISTQTSTDGSGDLWSQAEVWHRASNPGGLRAVLTRLTSASPSSAAPAAAAAVTAPQPAAAPAEGGAGAWTWALVGLAAGVALTVGAGQAWRRRRGIRDRLRRRPAPEEPSPAPADMETLTV